MEAVKTTYLKDYCPPDFFIETVDLCFNLEEDYTEVASRLMLHRNTEYLEKKPLVLQGEMLELLSVKLDGVALSPTSYYVDKEKLVIESVPDDFALEIVARIKPRENTALSGLYQSNGTFCTQCEAHGFRRITYFIDRPDVMARYTTRIEADKKKYPVLLSNGNPIKKGEKDGRHWVVWEDPFKKPSYLFALVAGDLAEKEDQFKTRTGRLIKLKIYVEKGNQNKVGHALYSLKQAMEWDEIQYGREYDLDIYMVVAVSDFNMGAMENKGLNIFNDKYVLADVMTATDQDYEAITSVIGHEYFHNWTGNRITCRDWFQLSLKEGLTVFRDQEFSRSVFSPVVERINAVRILRTRQFSEDEGPFAHPVRPDSYVEINNFYTTTVYNKGAEVIRMMQTLLGEKGFRRGMDLYFLRHDGQAVTTEEFVKAMEDANRVDFNQFRLWYSQAGTPEVTVTDEYDAKTKKYYLKFKQTCPSTPGQAHKKPLHIPIKMGLLTKKGKSIALQLEGESQSHSEKIISLKETESVFCFLNVSEKPIPSLLRDFSAPIKLHYNYTDEALFLLIRHDTDGFNRFEASQRLITKILFELIDDFNKGKKLRVPQALMGMFEALFSQEIEESLLAEMLILPSESYLSTLMTTVDVEGIHHVRQFLRKTIADQLHEIFFAAYQDEYDFKAYSLKDEGKRKLKNSCLSYLMCAGGEDFQEICLSQFERAGNMTDQFAAFSAFVNFENSFREAAIKDFYEQWRHERLVIDKWFALQAQSELPDTMARVQALTQHPDFNLKNPNRVRALVGAFVSGNPYYFHHASGEGYRFLSAMVIALDKLNPQVAARLVEALTHWRKYDVKRQTLMKAELEKIKQAPALSKDVFELVNKSLVSINNN
ncbi:MAG: aminopeptidase N [Gammaproteobacteria bacterium]|nr:aminopeptidase N [Gammaproteobacteria bacterium]